MQQMANFAIKALPFIASGTKRVIELSKDAATATLIPVDSTPPGYVVPPVTNPQLYAFGNPGTDQTLTFTNPNDFMFSGAFACGLWLEFGTGGNVTVAGINSSGAQTWKLKNVNEVNGVDGQAGIEGQINNVSGSTSLFRNSLIPRGRHRAVIDYDGSTDHNGLKLYVDAQLVGNVNNDAFTAMLSGGAVRVTGANARIDVLFFANRYLNSGEIAEDYNNGNRLTMEDVSFAGSLIDYYNFDGTLASGKGSHNATATTPQYVATTAPPSNPQVYAFGSPGTDQTLTFANPSDFVFTGPFSCGVWMDTSTNGQTIIGGTTSSGATTWRFKKVNEQPGASGQSGIESQIQDATSSNNIYRGSLLPVGRVRGVLTWDGSISADSLKIYANGTLVGNAGIDPGWAAMRPGGNVTATGVNTTIDVLFFANRALTAAEVSEDYNGGNRTTMAGTSFESSLIDYFLFDGSLVSAKGTHNATATSPQYVAG
jgi:hypothetical protein